MGYKIKIQRVERGSTKSFYVNFPAAVAEAGDIEKGEEMEWHIHDRDTYILKRITKSKSLISRKKRKLSWRVCPAGDSIVYFPSDSIIIRTDKFGIDTLNTFLIGYEYLPLEKEMLPIVSKIQLLFPNNPENAIILYKQYTPSEIMEQLKNKKWFLNFQII